MTHWRQRYKVHLTAEAFPMMPDEELDALTADLKKNGLKLLVTLAKDGRALEGRNRLEAIDRAGMPILPHHFHRYEGDDPVGFVMSANIHRRHMDVATRAATLVKLAKLETGLRTLVRDSRNVSALESAAGKVAGVGNRLAIMAREEIRQRQRALRAGRWSLMREI